MSDVPATRDLFAKHAAMLDRARRIATGDGGDDAVEATRVLNQLAEAYAWLETGTPGAVTSAASLLLQAEGRLRRLEEGPAARGGGSGVR